MPDHVLGIDAGTTGVTAIVFDGQAQPAGDGYARFEQHYPEPGWVEHEPEAIWDATRGAAREALEAADLDPGDLEAVGLTNQRETTILWDRGTGDPVHRAIVWQDRRTAPRCDELEDEGWAALVKERTGLLPDAYFSATKLEWILDEVPGARDRARSGELAFGTVDTWILWKLTGGAVHATDTSNASRTMLLDVDALAWDQELLDLFDVPPPVLPDVRPSSGRYGRTDPTVFGAEVPVAGVAGDQQAALFGQACFREGMVKSTYGTGSFTLANTGSTRVDHPALLSTVAWTVDGTTMYALEGSVFIAGAAVEWLGDELHLVDDIAEVEDLARSVRSTDGVYFVPALSGLGAPHWDPYARGTVVGLTRGTTKAHLVRAGLEAVAYSTADVLEAMAETDFHPQRVRADGGMAVNDFLLQFQSDVLDLPVERPEVTETTSLGAAALAGLEEGVWESRDELAKAWRREEGFSPRMGPGRRDELRRGWDRAVERAKGWATSEA